MTHADTSPFEFSGDRRGVLLVHGFVGTPFEMRPLGESLAARGFTVHGMRLAGHEPGLRDVGGTSWPDWLASVEAGLDELRGRCDSVGVCGLSLGGLLTLELARRRKQDIRAIAVLSAPVLLASWARRGIGLANRFRLLSHVGIPKLVGSDIADLAMRRMNPRPPGGMPVRAMASLVDLLDRVRPRLAEIETPALVAHARRDHTVPYASADAIAAGLRGPVERLTLHRSYHVITLDHERHELFARVGDFFGRNLPASP